MKMKTPEEYVADNGVTCPACGSEDLRGAGLEMEGNYVFQDICCETCGLSWSDVYKLEGYIDPINTDQEKS